MHLRRAAVAAVAVLTLLTAACSGSSGEGQSTPQGSGGPGGAASGAPQRGGSLTFMFPTAPLDLDPSTSQDNNVAMPLWNAWFEYLTVFDGNAYQPSLASSWTVSDDQKTYTFTLDERATFSDGSPVTASDVVFSLKRNISPDVSLLNFLNAKLESISASGAGTVVVELKEAWPHLLADMASPTAAIYSQKAYEQAGDPKTFFTEQPVGSGPFTLGTVTANSAYEVNRNQSYWKPDRQPYLDKILFQVVPDDTARVSAVLGGRADVVQSPPANQLSSLKSNDSVAVDAFPAARVVMIVLNTRQPPFDDEKVRRAFSLALDRKAIVQTGLFGYGEPATTFLVAPGSQTFQNPGLGLYPFDIEQAKQLLTESGVQQPVTVPLTVSTGADQDAILTVAQANLGEAGFTVVPSRKDAASVDNDIIGKSFTAATTFWGNVSGDPAIQPLFAVDPGYCCDAYFTGFDDPELVGALDKAIAEPDRAAAQPLWDDVQTGVAEAAFIVPLYYPQLTYLRTSAVRGFAATPAGFYDWAALGKASG